MQREHSSMVPFASLYLLTISTTRCRTISIETGAQNIQLCIAMMQLSFSAEYLVQLLNFALAYGLFQVLHGLLIVAGAWIPSPHQ